MKFQHIHNALTTQKSVAVYFKNGENWKNIQ